MFRRRLGLFVLLALLASAGVGTSSSLANVAPQQWQPTPADIARTLRPCPVAGDAAVAVCWRMTEDTSAWMAQPAGSPYGWGQCTYYVGVMRPDIWDHRAPPSVDPVTDWDAWTWAGHAQAEGLAVDGSPRAGDVMVWSRRAVGNGTGHVAMVDAVGGNDPDTGELELTISEMNLDGMDNPSLGQGDTVLLEVPRAQLVPGMIQFIHRSASGYATNPSFAVGVLSNHLATVTQSAAPLTATVTTPSGAIVKTMRIAANRVTALGLPARNDTVCVSQPAAGGWSAASGCASATSTTPATIARGTPAPTHPAHHGRKRHPAHHARRGQRGAPLRVAGADLPALVAPRIGVLSY